MDWQPTPVAVERALTKTQRMRTSPKPQWRDVRQRLEALGIPPQDVVLAEWEPEGEHLMCGVIATREERLFNFCVTYDYDKGGRPLEQDVGWLNSWTEIRPSEVGLTSDGYPNSWAQAARVARLVFEAERSPGSRLTD
jgi:hypothetical protein